MLLRSLAQDPGSFLVWLVSSVPSLTGWKDSLLSVDSTNHIHLILVEKSMSACFKKILFTNYLFTVSASLLLQVGIRRGAGC